ncbi:TRAP transporter substrate-binding protein DctP [Neobacillus drentensis]|uniref:TRAP transporter substrate-binding protein DctP n=1 Tax=Neobacillus drentensis TaxID=220684 RepID=UPI00082425F9|nr:TRAP transporter substrate-binding protein DctP [Neobacillus drentensis]
MKKSNNLFKMGSLMLALTLVLAACGGGKEVNGNASDSNGKNSKVIELNVNNNGPSTGIYATEVFEPWKKLVEEKTNGKVKVNLYHGSALGGTDTILNDVKGGVYEVGLVWTPYIMQSELFPLTIADLPFAGSADIKTNNEIVNKFAEKYIGDMGKDVQIMGISAAVPSYIFSTKPIKKYESLKNKKMRAVGSSEADTIKAWGAVPVSVTAEEHYESLQKGIIDISVTSLSRAIDTSLNEVVPYVVDLPYKSIQMVPIMNKSVYDQLPDNLKTLFKDDLSPALVQLVLDAQIKDNSTSMKKFTEIVKGKGGVTTLADKDIDSLKSKSKVAWDAWVEDANKKGYNGKEMMKEYQELLKEAGVDLPF